MISRQRLRQLRNQIPIDRVITELRLPSKMRDGYLRFLCPLCREFDTATKRETNLGRCFRCHRNFNPIDLVITVKNVPFLDAVEYLERLRTPRSITHVS